VEVVAMDGFTGFKTAAAEELPDAVTVMDPFHVVRLAGDALDTVPAPGPTRPPRPPRPQGDPLYRARRTLHTGADLLTDKQAERLTACSPRRARRGRGDLGHLPADDRRLPHEDRATGRELMVKLIDSVSTGVPTALVEVTKLGRTLKTRAADVLAYFDRPGTSNGPTEAINGRLEHLRGSALGFRNLTNYIARCLLESGGFRPSISWTRCGCLGQQAGIMAATSQTYSWLSQLTTSSSQDHTSARRSGSMQVAGSQGRASARGLPSAFFSSSLP
jgi:transposase